MNLITCALIERQSAVRARPFEKWDQYTVTTDAYVCYIDIDQKASGNDTWFRIPYISYIEECVVRRMAGGAWGGRREWYVLYSPYDAYVYFVRSASGNIFD